MRCFGPLVFSHINPSENGLWPGLGFSGCGWKIYGELWKADVASLGQMSPTHAGFFVPFWNHIWTLVRTLLVTNLEISGLICNLQGCSGCFGKHCIYKSSIDCTERYSFFGVLLGLSAVLVLSHHPTPLVQSPQVKSSRSASIGSAPS